MTIFFYICFLIFMTIIIIQLYMYIAIVYLCHIHQLYDIIRINVKIRNFNTNLK